MATYEVETSAKDKHWYRIEANSVDDAAAKFLDMQDNGTLPEPVRSDFAAYGEEMVRPPTLVQGE